MGDRVRTASRAVLLTALVAAAAAGCSIGGDVVLPEMQTPPAPPDYAAVIKAATEVFTASKMPGSAEISQLRPPPVTALADWMICLRSDAPGQPRYALFFAKQKLDAYRLAVQIDGCAGEAYAPLQPRIDDITQRPGPAPVRGKAGAGR